MGLAELSDYLYGTYSGKHWRRLGVRKRAGVLFPLFSIFSKRNMGIGEYPDLKLLVDWCYITGHSVIQLLPVNDSGINNYPYSSLSAFALNPIFLAPEIMDGSKNIRLEIGAPVSPCQDNRFNYAGIFQKKMFIFEKIFSSFNKKGFSSRKAEFQDFVSENEIWLRDYAEFMTLKEIHRWRPWDKWRSRYAARDRSALRKFRDFHSKRIDFFCYLQWQAHKQFADARRYARERGVLLKGDLPYLVGRDSADVWAKREYFNMDLAAGAPPDMFSKTGQKWGFPTYNWERIKRDGYSWYQSRLKKAERYFDLYRIDHALGVYRIFSIERSRPDGSIGFFEPKDPLSWEEHGETLIKMMLDATLMLPIAEDLGVVPECVRPNLKKLGVPRTIVERWERFYHGNGEFIDLREVEPVSMNTISTHDTETLRQWWRDNRDEREAFASHIVAEHIAEDLTPALHSRILERSLNSASLFTINLPQDIFTLDIFSKRPELHRINIPATVSEKNWSYSFPIPIEELVRPVSKDIENENKRIREMNERSGRC